MFAYFRGHRRGGSSSTPTAPPPANPIPEQRRPMSAVNLGSQPSFNSTSTPHLQISKPLSTARFSGQRFYAKSNLPENLSTEQEALLEWNMPPPISSLPPVLPPIPKIAESVEDQEEPTPVYTASELEKDKFQPSGGLPTIHLNPLRLNAVSPSCEGAHLDPLAVTTDPTTVEAIEPSPVEHEDEGSAVSHYKSEEDQTSSTAHRVRFNDDFALPEISTTGLLTIKSDSRDSAVGSTPSSPMPQDYSCSSNLLTFDPELRPPIMPGSGATSSQSSSCSSFPKPPDPHNTPLEPPSTSPPISLPRANPSPSVGPTIIKLGKQKRSLLKPVSLLMRRKTPTNLELAIDSNSINHKLNTAMSLPENYDPRIKGKGVHDFSAPRTKRNQSTYSLENNGGLKIGDASPVDEYRRRASAPWNVVQDDEEKSAERKSPEREHTAVFFENFQDTHDPNTKGSVAVHREALANQSFLARMSEKVDLSPAEALSKRIPPSLQAPKSPKMKPLPPVHVTQEQDASPNLTANASAALPMRRDDVGGGSVKSFDDVVNFDLSSQLLVPTQHSVSNASQRSRFSFQLTTDHSSVQEHELEEKHKRKTAILPGSTSTHGCSEYDLIDDDDDSTDFAEDDVDGQYEEAIPGVNADADDEDFDYPPAQSMSQIYMSYSGSTYGLSTSQSITAAHNPEQLPASDTIEHGQFNPRMEDLQASSSTVPRRQMTDVSNASDEMYFDDGQIETTSPRFSQVFDESIFDNSSNFLGRDDELFLHIPDLAKSSSMLPQLEAGNKISIGRGPREGGGLALTGDGKLTQLIIPGPEHGAVDLNAYHSALALAASQAAADGKFTREPSEDAHISQDVDTNPTITKVQDVDGSGTSGYSPNVYFMNDGLSSHSKDLAPEFGQAVDYIDFDDVEYDDSDLIEAANAEALAADDSDFYGREFDFYANPKKGRECSNGGYFGDPTTDGILRHSSLRDPTLTPITERSEFSRAPSYMSLSPFGAPPNGNNLAAPLPSPGLKELVGRINMEPDDISLKQLLKLRKETFGSSGHATGGAGSSPSSYSSSPIFMKNSLSPSHPLAPQIPEETEISDVSSIDDVHGHEYHGKESSDWDRSEMSTPSPTLLSPTFPSSQQIDAQPEKRSSYFGQFPVPVLMTLSPEPPKRTPIAQYFTPAAHETPLLTSPIMPMPSTQMMQKFAARPPASSATYNEREAEKKASTAYKRNSSSGTATTPGSDSVAYVQDDGAWYLEKRRTLNSGEVVVLARELVEGGRI